MTVTEMQTKAQAALDAAFAEQIGKMFIVLVDNLIDTAEGGVVANEAANAFSRGLTVSIRAHDLASKAITGWPSKGAYISQNIGRQPGEA